MTDLGHRSRRMALVILTLLAGSGGPGALSAQSIAGRVLDEVNGASVPHSRVLVIDTVGELVRAVEADAAGRYEVDLEVSVPFQIRVDALGYERLVTPRLVIEDQNHFELDLTLRPSPLGLEPLIVSAEGVSREAITKWLRLELGVHPASLGGKVIAGAELEALKTPGRDIVDLLRWANLPGAFVSRHAGNGGLCVIARGVSCAPIRFNGMHLDPADVVALPLEDIGAIVFLRSSDASSLFPGRGRRSSAGRIEIYSKAWTPWGR